MNNITLETANFSEQLGIYDFFNVLVSGATFIFGLCAINIKINDYLWNDVDISKGLGIVLLVYLTGIILQEFGSIWDSKCRKLYKQMNRSILKGNLLDDESGMPANKIIENPLLLKQYRSYADKLLNCLGASENEKNCFDKDFVSGFLFSVSQYYIAVSGKDKKVEKMRALYDMSRTLMIGFSLLTIYAIYSLHNNNINSVDISSLLGFDVNNCTNKAIFAIAFSVTSVTLYFRTKMIMKRFLLILLGTYDALMRFQEK